MTDWLTRILVSVYLFPDPEPERMARQLGAVYRVLTVDPKKGRSRARAGRSSRAAQRSSASRRG